jgi:hypothetical protein
MADWPILIAAAEDWIRLILKFIVPIIFVVIYLYNQLLSASKPKVPQPRPQRRPEGERALRPAQPPAKGAPASKLNDEIEQFLKRANDRRGDRAQREKRPSVKAPSKAPPKPLVETPLDAEVVERREFSSVSDSVEKHLANRGFSQRSEHLADDIVRADQQMEQHLQKSFSRRVGTFGDSAAQTAKEAPLTDTEPVVQNAAPSGASILGALLSNPLELKQAIVLNEILTRPEHRW